MENKNIVIGNDPHTQEYINKLTVDPRLKSESVWDYMCRIAGYSDPNGEYIPLEMGTDDLFSFFAYVAVCWSAEDKKELYDNWYIFADGQTYTFNCNSSHLTIKPKGMWVVTGERRSGIRVEFDGSFYLEDDNLEVTTIAEEIYSYCVPENRGK